MMKLRNKKTGVIYSIEDIDLGNNKDGIWLGLTLYKSLADLNEEWEDVPKEPKLFYVVDLDGEILPSDFEDKTIEKSKELGNYFETEEEAEKAVEKLKAWKRLKDNGFKFLDYTSLGVGEIKFEHNVMDEIEDIEQLEKDLDLLFGDKE